MVKRVAIGSILCLVVLVPSATGHSHHGKAKTGVSLETYEPNPFPSAHNGEFIGTVLSKKPRTRLTVCSSARSTQRRRRAPTSARSPSTSASRAGTRRSVRRSRSRARERATRSWSSRRTRRTARTTPKQIQPRSARVTSRTRSRSSSPDDRGSSGRPTLKSAFRPEPPAQTT
jgi:hypothetical protein